jgi:PBP1b-binding outer membrane lipoprotein LpoB
MKGYQQYIATICIMLIVFSSCQQRYWYRNKIQLTLTPKKEIVKITIVNESPNHFVKNIDKKLTQVSAKELKRRGLIMDSLRKPVFDFFVTIRIDSFDTKGIGFHSIPRFNTYSYSNKNVKAILFTYRLKNLKTGQVVSSFGNELYYHGIGTKDLSRCMQMVKYSIRSID